MCTLNDHRITCLFRDYVNMNTLTFIVSEWNYNFPKAPPKFVKFQLSVNRPITPDTYTYGKIIKRGNSYLGILYLADLYDPKIKESWVIKLESDKPGILIKKTTLPSAPILISIYNKAYIVTVGSKDKPLWLIDESLSATPVDCPRLPRWPFSLFTSEKEENIYMSRSTFSKLDKWFVQKFNPKTCEIKEIEVEYPPNIPSPCRNCMILGFKNNHMFYIPVLPLFLNRTESNDKVTRSGEYYLRSLNVCALNERECKFSELYPLDAFSIPKHLREDFYLENVLADMENSLLFFVFYPNIWMEYSEEAIKRFQDKIVILGFHFPYQVETG